MTVHRRGTGIVLAIAVAAAQPGTAQTSGDTAIAPGPQYGASALRRLLFGRDYRDLWTTPIRAPVVDLGTWGGGLTPTTAGGGMQTKSLRFVGADGLRYGFRSVDKDIGVLPPELRGTFVEDLVQDQTSAALPSGPAVAVPLMDAVGLLHTVPRLVVLPDAPALGPFRERFAGTLGFLEVRAVVDGGAPALAGAREVIAGEELVARADRGPGDRLDTRAFLRARLLDLLIGDWDRHRDQFRFARFDDARPTRWVVIPEDRDQAFVRYDGLMLAVARVQAPELGKFGPGYGPVWAWAWTGRELDRRFLVELDRPAWDSIVGDVRAHLTDSVIAAAAAAMPAEHYALRGRWLERALRARRDALADAAAAYYRWLARTVEVIATADADTAVVERGVDGSLDVRLFAAGTTYFRRRFAPGETREVRLYLGNGPDRVLVRGDGPDRIRLRVVGSGDDVLIDSSAAGGVRFHASGADRASGPGRPRVDRRRYTPPPKSGPTDLPPRDWGSRWQPMVVVASAPDLGFVFGGGALRTGYGFRKLPDASRVRVRAGYATAARTGRADFAGVFRRASSRRRAEVTALVSGLEVIRYHGIGNETDASASDEFYRVNQATVLLQPSVVLPLGRPELALGATLRYADTRDTPGRLIALAPPYGAGNFGQVGLRAELQWDGRDDGARPSIGGRLLVGAAWYPPVWDVDSAFGELHGEITGYLTGRTLPLRPTIALRVGGRTVRGHYPFHEAAFIGDERTVRLGRQHRYGGDAAAWANGEVRVRFGQYFVLLPGDIGALALGDVGRVWVEGERSSRWHGAFGGGVWVSIVRPTNILRIAVARSAERTGVYFGAGFSY